MRIRDLMLVWLAACGDDVSQAARDPHASRLAVSSTQVCALLASGVYCWEANFDADGTDVVKAPTHAELDPTDVVELAAASGRACVRHRTGQVACWGTNDEGQIGDGTRVSSQMPAPTSGIHDALQLAVDAQSTCVLRADHNVSCWGRSPESNPESGSVVPQTVADLDHIVELRAGTLDSYCARRDDGAVLCVRFRDGNWTAPTRVEALTGATTIALTFEDAVCGIVTAGEIRCSQLDTGNAVTLAQSAGSVQLRASGGLSACAQDSQANWHCWNVMPAAGSTAGAPRTPVTSDAPLIDVGISGFLTCGLTQQDQVACAAANSGPNTLRHLPLPR